MSSGATLIFGDEIDDGLVASVPEPEDDFSIDRWADDFGFDIDEYRDMTLQDWVNAGFVLIKKDIQGRWRLGDWILSGGRRFKLPYAEIAKRLGVSESTVAQWASFSNRMPHAFRPRYSHLVYSVVAEVINKTYSADPLENERIKFELLDQIAGHNRMDAIAANNEDPASTHSIITSSIARNMADALKIVPDDESKGKRLVVDVRPDEIFTVDFDSIQSFKLSPHSKHIKRPIPETARSVRIETRVYFVCIEGDDNGFDI